jgi:hypothetical protein
MLEGGALDARRSTPPLLLSLRRHGYLTGGVASGSTTTSITLAATTTSPLATIATTVKAAIAEDVLALSLTSLSQLALATTLIDGGTDGEVAT